MDNCININENHRYIIKYFRKLIQDNGYYLVVIHECVKCESLAIQVISRIN